MAEFDIAIITVTYNRLDDACLRWVRTVLDTSPLRVGFFVVDNGSTALNVHQKVKSVVPEAEVILRNHNHGFGRSSNLAAREANAKYYFFLNPDTEIADTSMLHGLHDFLEKHPHAGVAAPRVTYANGVLQSTCRRFPRWYMPAAERTSLLPEKLRERHRKHFHMEDFDHAETRMVDWVQGSAIMMPAALFQEIGGFDERYRLYIEDVDLCREAWARKRPVYYVPQFTMKHAYGKASEGDRGILHSLFLNPATRWHIMSFLKYQWKWLWRRHE